MITTIKGEKGYFEAQCGFLTRQDAAEFLRLHDGSNIDRIMAGYPCLTIPRKDGKSARMYHRSDVCHIVRMRRQNAPELFDRQTIKATAKDKRKTQQDADIKTLINMEG